MRPRPVALTRTAAPSVSSRPPRRAGAGAAGGGGAAVPVAGAGGATAAGVATGAGGAGAAGAARPPDGRRRRTRALAADDRADPRDEDGEVRRLPVEERRRPGFVPFRDLAQHVVAREQRVHVGRPEDDLPLLRRDEEVFPSRGRPRPPPRARRCAPRPSWSAPRASAPRAARRRGVPSSSASSPSSRAARGPPPPCGRGRTAARRRNRRPRRSCEAPREAVEQPRLGRGARRRPPRRAPPRP